MKYLPNSPFYGLITAEELQSQELICKRELADLPECKVLLEFSEPLLDRSVIADLGQKLQTYPQITWYVLPASDRNLASFRDWANTRKLIGAYVPTDELLYKCPYFQSTINFGAQVDLLRRIFIVIGRAFALCDLWAIRDTKHYLEMVAGLAEEIHPIRQHEDFPRFLLEFSSLKRR